MEVGFDATPFLSVFRDDQATVAIDIVERLEDGTTIQVKLSGRFVHVPSIGTHIRDELSRRLAPPLEHELPTPRVSDTYKKVVR